MNFRYSETTDRSLEDLIARSPDCDLDDIRRALPALSGVSTDHLALRVEQIVRTRSFAPAK